MKERPNILLRGLAVILLFTMAGMLLGMAPGGDVMSLLLQLTIGQVLQAGWYLFCLRLVREEEVNVSTIFEPFRRFWQVWLVMIAVPLITAAGLFLFIIPGLYFWARFGMAMFAAVDRELDVSSAFDFSSRITEGNRLQILLLQLIVAGIGVVLVLPTLLQMKSLEMIALPLYVFVMTPLAGTSYAAAYDSLVETKAGEEV
jgi:hypothetical protein